MASRSYYLHQAQVCQSLANGTTDPALKDRYTRLALDFLDRAAENDEDDPGDFLAFLTGSRKKPSGGDTSPNE
jgi:hypothetical protein